MRLFFTLRCIQILLFEETPQKNHSYLCFAIFLTFFWANDHLIEFHLIKIVFYHLIKIMLITWSNFLTLFTWSKFVIMISIKRLKINHLIELFDQVPKAISSFLAVDRNFKKPKIPLLELSINCQKRTYGFWQLIETF